MHFASDYGFSSAGQLPEPTRAEDPHSYMLWNDSKFIKRLASASVEGLRAAYEQNSDMGSLESRDDIAAATAALNVIDAIATYRFGPNWDLPEDRA